MAILPILEMEHFFNLKKIKMGTETKNQNFVEDNNLQPEVMFIPEDEPARVPLSISGNNAYDEDLSVLGFMERNFFMD